MLNIYVAKLPLSANKNLRHSLGLKIPEKWPKFLLADSGNLATYMFNIRDFEMACTGFCTDPVHFTKSYTFISGIIYNTTIQIKSKIKI